MTTTESQSQSLIGTQDVARWFTFTGFWGFVFYLLSFAGLLRGQRRQPVSVDTDTAIVGMGIHIGVFVTAGSLFSAGASLVRRQSTTQQARQRVDDGTIERTIPLQAVGGAIGSIIPFAMAVGSIRAAERVTGKALFPDGNDIAWSRAIGTTALLSGVTALAISRIAAWVANDARQSR